MTIDIDHIEQLARGDEHVVWLSSSTVLELIAECRRAQDQERHWKEGATRVADGAKADRAELLARLRAAEADAERASKRADFYQERAAAGLEALEDVARAVCRSSMPIAEQQPMLARIGQAQEKHGEAGRAFMERLRTAENLLAETAARLSRHRDVIDQWVCENVLDHFERRAVEASK
jgi:hypothetical protein